MIPRRFRLSLGTLLLSLGLLSTAQAELGNQAEVQQFIDRMVDEHGFSRQNLEQQFSQVKIRQDILDAISRPAESKPWYQYRPIFLTEDRIRGGIAFWRRHAETLAEAERRYGVPPEIIVAILGVETRYGRHRGGYRVMDALSTLAFAYPPRARFFRSELEHFLLMTREERISPLSLKGSYAGAMGQPQFIASSFRSYAVDFDGDGHRDLWDNISDVIGSVANYFKRHGWQPGGTIVVPARVSGERHTELLEAGLKPHLPAARLGDYGVAAKVELPPDTLTALLALETGNSPEYWLMLHNFYVITRYNHSPLYAMAVYQLAQAIRSSRKEL